MKVDVFPDVTNVYEKRDIDDVNFAIELPKFDKLTLAITSISNGKVTVRYSLSSVKDIENDTAIWINSKLTTIEENNVITFSDNIAYISFVVTDPATRFTTQIRSS